MDSRKRQKAVTVTGILLALLALVAIAQELLPVPALTGRVIDQTGTLSEDQISKLEARLAALEAERGSQIVVLLVPTTKPEDIAAYANRVANTWKPGRRDVGNGLLLVVAKNDRTVRIEVARALEGAVPDAAAQQIIDQRIVPAFRAGDFHAGLDRGLDALMARIRGEALPAPSRSTELPDRASQHVTGPGPDDGAAQVASLLANSDVILKMFDQFGAFGSPLAREVVLEDEVWSAFAADLAAIYRKEFTGAELDELLRFLSSDVGRKWLTRSPEITKEMMAGPSVRHMAYAGCIAAFLDAAVRSIQSRAAQTGDSIPDNELRRFLREQIVPNVRPTCQCFVDKVIEKYGAQAFVNRDVAEVIGPEIDQLRSSCPAPDDFEN